MPTTYAHDLFGERLSRCMPEEIRELICAHEEIYRIGLHGPDILFYFPWRKKSVSQYGTFMHKTPAAGFFLQGMERVRRTGNEELTAYLLGFACHYLLDSACHPFVRKMAKKKVITHRQLERELDRALMLAEGKDPMKYHPSDAIKARFHYGRVIYQVIPSVSVFCIYLCLHMMKCITNAMVDWNPLLGEGIKTRMSIKQYFLTEEPCEESKEPVAELRKLFEEAVRQGEIALPELAGLLKEDRPLSSIWHRTYNG